MRYATLGQLPPKRHSQFRDHGRLLVEEVMGYEGFSGNESILYHVNSPCRIAEVGELRPLQRDQWVPDAHVHRLTDLRAVGPGGDPVSGMQVLMFNGDLEVSVCKPTEAPAGFYRNGQGDEVIYVHRGGGVLLNGLPAPAPPGERHDADGRLEIVAIESADPRWVAASAADLAEVAHRFRALGTIAVALCQLAATRVDGFVTLWRTRAVDVAAAQLIVRESGGLVAFPAFADPLGAPLDLRPHSPVIAARTPEALERLRAVPMEGR